MCIANNNKIIIAAITSRAYVKSAVVDGFEVVAIDAFADADTQHMARRCYQITLNGNQLDAKQLIATLDSMDLQSVTGFCYGAGFEQIPAILSQINERITVLGNTAAVVEQCKAVDYFFNLCDSLNIPYPPVRTSRPLHSYGWIQKEIGGSGGGHIQQFFDVQDVEKENVYYQQLQAGKSISCLFLASDNAVQVIGFSEQWLSEQSTAPFCYGGAVSNADISKQAAVRLTEYVSKLSKAIGLIGLNSCDAICDGDSVYVLEINPRLSATIDLYASKRCNLMAVHVAACQHDLDINLTLLNNDESNRAHQVVYAKQDLIVKSNMSWPDWVCDRPKTQVRFKMGSPICTVIAEAETPLLAKRLVHERSVELYGNLLN